MASFSIFSLLFALQALLLVSGLPAGTSINSNGNGTSSGTTGAASSFWMSSISRQGTVAFGTSGYKVFRNVMDYGAKGDGKFAFT